MFYTETTTANVIIGGCAGSHTAVARTPSTSLHRDVIDVGGGAAVTASEFRHETFRRPALALGGRTRKRRRLRRRRASGWGANGGCRAGEERAAGWERGRRVGRRDVVGARAPRSFFPLCPSPCAVLARPTCAARRPVRPLPFSVGPRSVAVLASARFRLRFRFHSFYVFTRCFHCRDSRSCPRVHDILKYIIIARLFIHPPDGE